MVVKSICDKSLIESDADRSMTGHEDHRSPTWANVIRHAGNSCWRLNAETSISAQRLIVFCHIMTACCALVISHASSLLENGRSRTKWMVTKNHRANGSFFAAGVRDAQRLKLACHLFHREWWEETRKPVNQANPIVRCGIPDPRRFNT